MSLMKSDVMVKVFIFLCVIIFFSCTTVPQPKEQSIRRVALVIGNQDYVDNALENPRNDARGIAQTLEGIGFEVILRFDVTLQD